MRSLRELPSLSEERNVEEIRENAFGKSHLVKETDAPAKHWQGVGSNGVLAGLVRVEHAVFQDKPAPLPLQPALLLPQVAGHLASLRVGRKLESRRYKSCHMTSRRLTSFKSQSQVNVLTVNWGQDCKEAQGGVELLTSLDCIIASITDAGRLKLAIAQRSLARRALCTDHLSAATTVVAPTHQGELGAARLAHCHPLVWNPDGSCISNLSLEPQDWVEVVKGDKGGFPAPVFLYGTVESVQPAVTLFHVPEERGVITDTNLDGCIPGFQCTAPHIAGDAELVLKVLCRGHMDVQLVEGDGVAHFQAGRVAGPAAVVGGVEETVAEEDEVSRTDSLPRDLLQFSLL